MHVPNHKRRSCWKRFSWGWPEPGILRFESRHQPAGPCAWWWVRWWERCMMGEVVEVGGEWELYFICYVFSFLMVVNWTSFLLGIWGFDVSFFSSLIKNLTTLCFPLLAKKCLCFPWLLLHPCGFTWIVHYLSNNWLINSSFYSCLC